MDRLWNFVFTRLEAIGWLEFLLLLMLSYAVYVFRKAHRDPNSKIDCEDLFLGPNDKVALEKVLMFWAFLFSSWGLVALISRNTLSEWYFVGYMAAWVAARGTYMWLTSKGAQNVPPA